MSQNVATNGILNDILLYVIFNVTKSENIKDTLERPAEVSCVMKVISESISDYCHHSIQ
jgi:hypothetical protein